MFRPSDNPVPRDVYDEALKEHKARTPGAGYYRIRDVHAASKKVVVAISEKLTPLSTQNSLPDPRLMTDEELVLWGAELLKADRYDWESIARPEQLEPDEYHTFLYSAGRGAGKTRAAAEIVRKWCKEKPGSRIAILALGHRELRDVCLDGPSGLLNVIPPEEILSVKKGLGDLSIVLKNGSEIHGFTSGNAESLRGRSFDAAWCDEYAAWARNSAQDVLDQLWFCLRESKKPRVLITTTPRKVPHVVDLFKRAEKDVGIVIRQGRTRDNTALSEAALAQLEMVYGGTRLGRQELEGILLLDVEGALWTESLLAPARMDREMELPLLREVIIGYDFSGSEDGDEAGIVAIGWDSKKTIYVLENKTTGGTPAVRYGEACLCAHRNKASRIYYEGVHGDVHKFALEQQWKTLVEQGAIPEAAKRPLILPSNIKGSKADRAQPVVAMYEKHAIALENDKSPVVLHVSPTVSNGMAKLESELTSWEPHSRLSPNALDAYVHAARQAMRTLGYEMAAPSRVNKKRRIDRGWTP